GPGGSPSALTVGAADLRARFGEARVVLRAGLSVEFDDVVPLAGSALPAAPIDARVGVPRSHAQEAPAGSVPLVDFFDSAGRDLVAGRAALVPVGADPATTFADAAPAGATPRLLQRASLARGPARR